MEFNNECFKSWFVKMERWYDVKNTGTDSTFISPPFREILTKKQLKQALEALTFTVPFKYKMN